jgi:uncharacterized coiled-coil DUF342 family protein
MSDGLELEPENKDGDPALSVREAFARAEALKEETAELSMRIEEYRRRLQPPT